MGSACEIQQQLHLLAACRLYAAAHYNQAGSLITSAEVKRVFQPVLVRGTQQQ